MQYNPFNDDEYDKPAPAPDGPEYNAFILELARKGNSKRLIELVEVSTHFQRVAALNLILDKCTVAELLELKSLTKKFGSLWTTVSNKKNPTIQGTIRHYPNEYLFNLAKTGEYVKLREIAATMDENELVAFICLLVDHSEDLDHSALSTFMRQYRSVLNRIVKE